jgi:hypothetical protein
VSANGTGPLHYDRQGRVISLSDWSHLATQDSYVLVESTDEEGLSVKTCWLGTDQYEVRYDKPGDPPLIFSTLSTRPTGRAEIFTGTEEAARQTHQRVVSTATREHRTTPNS